MSSLSSRSLVNLAAFLTLAGSSVAAPPAPDKLLPDSTLVVLTAPDFSRLRAIWEKMPQKKFWNDPAMKAFRDDFSSKWQDQFIKPLERDLDIKIEDYSSLLQGQVTVALTEDSGHDENQSGGLLLLVDAKDKSSQLKKNLASLRKKWTDAGKLVKNTKIRDCDFTILTLSTNDFPKTLRRFFPKSPEVHELGEDTPKHEDSTDELVIGQVESLLVISTSQNAAEKVVARVTGGSVPPLADVASYQADYSAFFRDAPLYGWVNLKRIVDALTHKFGEHKENSEAPNPFDLKPEKMFGAIGLNGLKTLAFSFQQANEGSTLQVSIGAPESSRQGLVKIFAGEPRETRPPAFVPADAVKFQRWRIDGQKGWETLQKMISDISPQWLNGINFVLETANTAAREKNPGFDIRKNLIGNIGDDMISYQKPSPLNSAPALTPPPSLFLLGSPKAEELAGSLKSIFVFASQQSGSAPEERDFLGRKIYTVSLKSVMVPLGAGNSPAVPRSLTYAASGGYVAFSSDPTMVEEYLRSSDGQHKSLRETPGLAEASQKVSGSSSSLFGYVNQAESMRTVFELLRKNPAHPPTSTTGAAANLLQSGLNVPGSVESFRELMDFSLLPNFDAVAKYFYFRVYGGGANVDGLSYKIFEPTPPGLKNQ